MTLLHAIHEIVENRALSESDAEDVMGGILSGSSTPALIASFLVALRMKGETAEEITGFARAMRSAAKPLPVRDKFRPLLDTCGTGGGGVSAFNISTAVAFVAAGAGIHVAKHGNRSISSQCGSADVLEALGVRTRTGTEAVIAAIEQVGIGFLFAPSFHEAMRHVQPVRLELKLRTVFNFLGPLTNPASAELQVVGTSSEQVAEKLAHALPRLGLKRGFVVSGSDGLGEVTTTGPSTLFAIHNGSVTRSVVEPADFGFEVHGPDKIRGGDSKYNSEAIIGVLRADRGPHREIVLMNAALAMIAGGKAQTLREGVDVAAQSIDSGHALHKLNQLAQHTAAAAG